MFGHCQNCQRNPADKQVMPQMTLGTIYDVCAACRDLLVKYSGFTDVTLGPPPSAAPVHINVKMMSGSSTPTQHKGYSVGYDKGYTLKLKECECGNKDKPMNCQLHSDWCPGYKKEFR